MQLTELSRPPCPSFPLVTLHTWDWGLLTRTDDDLPGCIDKTYDLLVEHFTVSKDKHM